MLHLSTRFHALRRRFSGFRLLLAGTTLLYLLGGTLAASTASAQEFSREELKRALQATVRQRHHHGCRGRLYSDQLPRHG
jgi:hypothetical protein